MTVQTFNRQMKAYLFHILCAVKRRNIHRQPVLLWHFRDSGAGYKTADLLTYLQVEARQCNVKTSKLPPSNCNTAIPACKQYIKLPNKVRTESNMYNRDNI